ncbi:MAG: hypothetical protein AAF429_04990 [Pseudomonadota bacterium]
MRKIVFIPEITVDRNRYVFSKEDLEFSIDHPYDQEIRIIVENYNLGMTIGLLGPAVAFCLEDILRISLLLDEQNPYQTYLVESSEFFDELLELAFYCVSEPESTISCFFESEFQYEAESIFRDFFLQGPEGDLTGAFSSLILTHFIKVTNRLNWASGFLFKNDRKDKIRPSRVIPFKSTKMEHENKEPEYIKKRSESN